MTFAGIFGTETGAGVEGGSGTGTGAGVGGGDGADGVSVGRGPYSILCFYKDKSLIWNGKIIKPRLGNSIYLTDIAGYLFVNSPANS